MTATPWPVPEELTESASFSALADARLLIWRSVLAVRSAEALRRYHDAWSAPELDDAERAVAGVGALDLVPVSASEPAADHLCRVLPGGGPLADLSVAARLDLAAEAVLAAAWWSSVDPQVAVAFGCVHDDASRRYPSLALLAHLFASAAGIDIPLTIIASHPLARNGLLEPVTDADAPLRLSPATAAILAGQRPAVPTPGPVPARLGGAVTQAAALVGDDERVLVRCQALEERSWVRDAVAARLDIGIAPSHRGPALAQVLLAIGHELPAVLLDGTDPPPSGSVLAIGGSDATAPAGWHTLDVPAPALPAAEQHWRSALRRAGVLASGVDVTTLAGRLPLAERTITGVVAAAAASAAAAGRAPTVADVGTALRGQPRHDPGELARRMPATLELADLVLPETTRDSLVEVIAHARFSPSVHERLGLIESRGRAVIALFHGPSGTGKTAAAEAIATAVDRELWVVDLAKVVSKWLGETQRNLDTLLADAAVAGVVLLFDEADGLFGKRGEVTDARDRYANLEIDHLLQRIELHTGVVVLTSNRPAALDEAFARRIRISVRFELPDHPDREELWRRYLPAALLADGSSTCLAAREELSGAAIRSAAVAACVIAMADGTAVTNGHLDLAVRRELEKSGRLRTARAVRP